MKNLILSLVTAGAFLASAHAFADTVIFDDFSKGGVIGRAAYPTDLPGTDWTDAENTWGAPLNGGNSFAMNTDQSVEISLGSYAASPILSISTYVLDHNLVGGGVGVGFFTPAYATGGHGPSGFTGLLLDQGTGDLDVYADGSDKGTVTSWDTAASGTYSDNTTYTLSYTLNTVTGSFSDVLLDGHNYSSNFTSSYSSITTTSGVTDYAGSMVTNDVGGKYGYFGIDFTVSTPTVPEPGTDALFAIGCCLVLAGWLRVRRSKA